MTMEVTCSGLTSELLGGRDRSGVHTRLGLCPLLPPRLSPEGRVREGTRSVPHSLRWKKSRWYLPGWHAWEGSLSPYIRHVISWGTQGHCVANDLPVPVLFLQTREGAQGVSGGWQIFSKVLSFLW